MRLIDADALIEDLEAAKANNGMGGMVANALVRYVKRCSTVDAVPVQRWIPVTERLPEEDGSYLCFSQYCGSGWCAVRGFAKDGRKKDEYDFQRRWKNVWYDYDSKYGYCVIDSITHCSPPFSWAALAGASNG